MNSCLVSSCPLVICKTTSLFLAVTLWDVSHEIIIKASSSDNTYQLLVFDFLNLIFRFFIAHTKCTL